MLEEHQEEEQEQDNVSTSRNIFEKKKTMLARVKETKTRLLQQRRPNFYLPEVGLKSYPEILLEVEPDFSHFSSYVDNIYSRDERTQYSGLLGLRKIFVEKPQQTLLQFDPEIIPRFIEFLTYDQIPYFQLEAAWILSIITYGNTDQIRPILQNGVFPCLKKLLLVHKDEIADDIVTGVGNIAGESTQYRDILLQWGMLELLLDKVKKSNTKNKRKDLIWAISNLCRGDPRPDIRLVRVAIPTMCEAIKNEKDEEIVSDASWTLNSMVLDPTCINTIINSDVTPALIRNFKHPRLGILIPSMRIICQLLVRTKEQTNKVLCDPDLLSSLATLLSHWNNDVRKETCWVLSNIAAGSNDDIVKIINTPQCLSQLFYICQNDEMEVKREAFWTLSNITHKVEHDQIIVLLQNDIYNLFITNLNCSDDKTTRIIIQGLINILEREDLSFEERQCFRGDDIEDGWKKIQALTSSPNLEIHNKSVQLAQLHQKRF